MAALLFTLLLVGLLLGLIAVFNSLATLLGISILFTYLLLPLVDSLEVLISRALSIPQPRPRRWKRLQLPKALVQSSVPSLTPRLVAVLTLYTLLGFQVALAVTFGLPILNAQGAELLHSLPKYCIQIRQVLLPWFPGLPALPFDQATWPLWLQRQTQDWITSGAAPQALTHLGDWSAMGLRGVIYVVSTVSTVFYLLLDGRQRGEWLLQVIPDARWRLVLEECHRVLLRFVRGQVLLAIISGLLMFSLYSLFGVPHALILSLVFTVAEIFPVIGPWFAFTPGITVMLLGENPWVTVYVLGIYFLLKDNIILPKVVGEVMGIHPVWIILAILIAAQTGGAIGIIFAVPLSAILGVLWQNWQKSRTVTTLDVLRRPNCST